MNSLEDTLLMLNTYKQIGIGGIGNRNKNVVAPNESGMVFTQVGGNVRDIDKKTYTVTHAGLKGIGTRNVLSRGLSE